MRKTERGSAPASAGPSAAIPPGELVRACLEHRAGAWNELLRRYANLIYSTLLKVDLSREDQEDAFQATVLAIYRDLARLREPDHLSSWIIGIAYRQGVDRIRSRRRAHETSLDQIEPDDLEPVSGGSSAGLPPDEARLRLERAQRVQEAFERLPERCRRLLHALFVEDPEPDYVEISKRLGLPVGSIGPTRGRCLEKVRRFFQERGWIP